MKDEWETMAPVEEAHACVVGRRLKSTPHRSAVLTTGHVRSEGIAGGQNGVISVTVAHLQLFRPAYKRRRGLGGRRLHPTDGQRQRLWHDTTGTGQDLRFVLHHGIHRPRPRTRSSAGNLRATAAQFTWPALNRQCAHRVQQPSGLERAKGQHNPGIRALSGTVLVVETKNRSPCRLQTASQKEASLAWSGGRRYRCTTVSIKKLRHPSDLARHASLWQVQP